MDMKCAPSTSSRKKLTTKNRAKEGKREKSKLRRQNSSREEDEEEDVPRSMRNKVKKREVQEQRAEDEKRGRRKGKRKHVDENFEQINDEEIMINRAPVLTLWVAVVAERQGFEFAEGLSFGRAIAGLMAQSKGRRLGIYEEASEEEKAERKRKRKALERFSVFGMNVPGKIAQSGLRLAVQNNKPISPSPVQGYLHKSFGAKYEAAKAAMEDLASSYSPQEIGKVAYSLYEAFRPEIPYGVKGWGAKGILDIQSMQTLKKQ